jgi:hypothetical protein
MRIFFDGRGRTRVFGPRVAGQGRLTFKYVAAGNPRRTKASGKKAIYGWTLKREENANNRYYPWFYVEIDVRQQLQHLFN